MQLRSALTFAICSFAPFILRAVDAPDVTALVDKAAANYRAREASSVNFTYTESVRNWNFNPKGKTTLQVSDTFEVIFLEGAPYFRRTAHNDRPLSEKEERKEQEKMDGIAKARRSGNRSAGIYPHALTLKLPIAELPTGFSLTSRGEELIDGRKMFVVDAVPSGRASEANVLANAVHMSLWIDQQDAQIAKVRAEVFKESGRYRPGAVVEVDYEKVHDEVWLLKRFHFKGDVADTSRTVSAEAEEECSNYRKFSSESKIVSQ